MPVGTMRAIESSQLIGIKGFTLAATVGIQHILNQSLKLCSIGSSGPHPALILFHFVQQEVCKLILPICRHLRESLNGLFECFCRT
jgi:hypothetical protein